MTDSHASTLPAVAISAPSSTSVTARAAHLGQNKVRQISRYSIFVFIYSCYSSPVMGGRRRRCQLKLRRTRSLPTRARRRAAAWFS